MSRPTAALAGQRVAMGIEYNGSGFHGWQAQAEARTVQASLETAIAAVADHPVRVHCAGRTDAGVHALEQVIHFDSPAPRSERAWVLGTNVHLPADVAVLWAQRVGADFHARYRAQARHYRYLILCRDTRSALLCDRAVWVRQDLDLARMRLAAADLVGEHDFSSFRALACQAKSPVRRVHYVELVREGDLIELRIGANGFLHHMVRNIAGVLITIGRGEAEVGWVRELLALRDRTRGGVTAAAHGLYFVRADYPAGLPLPQCPAPYAIPAASRSYVDAANPG